MEAKIDKLTSLVTTLTESVDGLKDDIRGIKQDIEGVKSNITELNSKVDTIEDTIEDTVQRKIESLKDTWRDQMQTMVANTVDETKENILGEMNDFVIKKLDDMGITDMITRQTEMENNIKDLQRMLDKPFDPERSVVVYGMADKEGETLDQTVSWLIKDVLGLTVTPKFYERTTPKGDKVGVIKIELHNAFDKVAILRAKRKCEENALTKKVRINSCDSHESRVAKINARFILSRLPKAKDFMVSANGVIRAKPQLAENDEQKDIPEDETTPTEES